MDENTIKSLETAYKVAPSVDLAKVIVTYYVSQGQTQNALPFLSDVANVLENDQHIQLVKLLAAQDQGQALQDYCALLDVANSHRLIDALIDIGRNEQAKSIYLAVKETNVGIRDVRYEELFTLTDQKAKLTLVEKVDMEDVVDMVRYRDQTTTFDDVVGLNEIKKQINKKIILPFQKPSLFSRFKKKVGGGVLLYGPPGCGKTLLARAAAGECNASFFNIEISDVLDMYIGESEQKLHAIFEKARAEKPSVLFFDELEALAGKREHMRNSSSSNTVSQFLTELDGFANDNHSVLVLASTNVPWAIDSAFLRPGRFDRMFFVPPPDVEARQSILEHHMNERPSDDDINYSVLASKTSGYSGADLANLVEMAADEAIDESIETDQDTLIRMEHFKAALTGSRSTTTEWLTTARNYARYANDGGRYDDVLNFMKKHGK